MYASLAKMAVSSPVMRKMAVKAAQSPKMQKMALQQMKLNNKKIMEAATKMQNITKQMSLNKLQNSPMIAGVLNKPLHNMKNVLHKQVNGLMKQNQQLIKNA